MIDITVAMRSSKPHTPVTLHRPPALPRPPAAMVASASLVEQLKAAERAEAKARATEVSLKAALDMAKVERAEFAREAHRLRQKIARGGRREVLGQGQRQKGAAAAAPAAPVAPAKKMGRPPVAGCFQCRFLARGGAVGRRGGKVHTCGGPTSEEYQKWARVRAAVRAKTLAGRGPPVKATKTKAVGQRQ